MSETINNNNSNKTVTNIYTELSSEANAFGGTVTNTARLLGVIVKLVGAMVGAVMSVTNITFALTQRTEVGKQLHSNSLLNCASQNSVNSIVEAGIKDAKSLENGYE